MLGQESPRRVSRQAALVPLRDSQTARRLGLLAVFILLGGCATAAEVTGTATQSDLMQLRGEVATLRLTAQQAKAQADAVAAQADARAREQRAESERQATALNRRLDGLATSVSALSARVDQLATRVEALTRQARGTATPPARPPAPAPGVPAPAAPGTAAPAPGTTPPPAPAPARPATGALQPRDIYQAAYIDFSKGSYTLAISGFREFVRRYPDDDLADNAQYWIGESYVSLARGYANGNQPEQAGQALQQAVQELRKVVADYPRGDKTPAALYKEALVLIELRQPQVAQTRLQYLVDNFPQAEETPLARERLTALKNP